MKLLTKQQTRNPMTQIAVLLGLIAIILLGGCLGLLVLKQKIATSAQMTQKMEREIEKEERRNRYLATKIAEIHQPNYLQAEIARLNLKLRAPSPDQIVYLQDRIQNQYVRRTEREATKERVDPFRRSFDLAVMEPIRSLD